MKLKLITAMFCLSIFSTVNAQESGNKTVVLQREVLSLKNRPIENLPLPELAEPSAETQETQQQTNKYVRPEAKKRLKNYVNRTIGPIALAKNAASAGFSTITNNPEEWERTGTGFARRFASKTGENAIKQTTVYVLDEVLKLDSSYYKSQKKDFGSRVKNAFVSTFTARRSNGDRTFGAPRIAGTYASHIISREVWYPERFSYKDGLRSGTYSLGFNVLTNILQEFF